MTTGIISRKKIPQSIRDKDASIPWKKMAGMRDKMAQEYFGVDLEILWKVAKEDIPPLRPSIQDILKNLQQQRKGLKKTRGIN